MRPFRIAGFILLGTVVIASFIHQLHIRPQAAIFAGLVGSASALVIPTDDHRYAKARFATAVAAIAIASAIIVTSPSYVL